MDRNLFSLTAPIGRLHYVLSVLVVKAIQASLAYALIGSLGMSPMHPFANAMLFRGQITTFLMLNLLFVAILFVLASKRVRDIGKSQWLLLLFLVPLANLFFMLYLILKKGKRGMVKATVTPVTPTS